MKRVFAILLSVFIVFSVSVPATASSDSTAWTELLDYCSVRSDGTNYFTFSGQTDIKLDWEGLIIVSYVDILLTNYASPITSATLMYGDVVIKSLTIEQVGYYSYRIYGSIPASVLASLSVRFTSDGSSSCYLESFRVCKHTDSGVYPNDLILGVLHDGIDVTDNILVGNTYKIPATKSNYADCSGASFWIHDIYRSGDLDQLGIWSFDRLELQFTSLGLDWTGFSASVEYSDGAFASLPVTVSFFSTSTNQIYTDPYLLSLTDLVYITVVVDMSEVNRALVSKLNLMFTANYVECLPVTLWFDYATLYNNTADDLGPAYWWAQVKSFFTGLFSGFFSVDSDADDFQNTVESQVDEMDDMVDQMEQVTKPDIDDIDINFDSYVDSSDVGAFTDSLAVVFDSDIVITMIMITLTLALVSYVLYGKR